jgi:hypothetical protein
MTLKGKDAEAFLDGIEQRNREEKEQQLAKAIANATAKGKEPFDLEKLERLCDTSREGRLEPDNERRARLEYKYYVTNPEIMTIAEFARLIDELGKW